MKFSGLASIKGSFDMTKFWVIEIEGPSQTSLPKFKNFTARTKMLKFSGQVIVKGEEWQKFWIPRYRIIPQMGL